MKHQVYFRDPRTGRDQGAVVTLWTWRNEHPVPAARLDYEVGALIGAVQGTSWRNATRGGAPATWVKSWDFGTSPPVRVRSVRVWPLVTMLGGTDLPPSTSAVVALRTQPVGSAVRNRLNGRKHHPYAASPLNGSGSFSGTGTKTQIQNAWNAILTTLRPAASANSGQWVVPCFWEGGVLRPGGPLLPAVDHIIVRDEPGVVRSRLYRQGPYARGA